MDDDLRSLMGDISSGDDDDDMFGGFDDDDDFLGQFDAGPDDEPPDISEPPPAPRGDESVPDWLQDLKPPEEMEETVPAAAASTKKVKEKKPKSKKKKKAASPAGDFMGLKPQQVMFVSIFLFLDVAVLGFGALIATGAIALF